MHTSAHKSGRRRTRGALRLCGCMSDEVVEVSLMRVSGRVLDSATTRINGKFLSTHVPRAWCRSSMEARNASSIPIVMCHTSLRCVMLFWRQPLLALYSS
jgi:hypothetical protein